MPAGLRSGITLLEVLITAVLLGSVMIVTVPTIRWIGLEQRLAQRRQAAVQEVHNVVERITARTYDEITPELAGEWELGADISRELPSSDLDVSLELSEETADAKRVTVKLRWKAGAHRPDYFVSATTWVYRRGNAQ